MSNVISYRDENSNRDLKLDIDTGHVYDLSGNQVAKWDPVDDFRQPLADYALSYSQATMIAAMKGADPDRAHAMAQSFAEESGIVAMDLGVSDIQQSAPIPNYAAGYRNEMPMADMFSPPLRQPKPAGKFYTFDKNDAFQRALPVGASAASGVDEIAPRLANTGFTTVERAVGAFVGTEIEAAADAPLRIRQAAAKRVMNALNIEREIRVASLARTQGNWDASVYASVLSGAKWNGGATSDPIADLHARLEASWGTATGIIMAYPTYNAFVRNPAVKGYYAYKDSTAPIPKPAEVSALLQLPPIYVAKFRHINAAGTLVYTWGGDVVLVRQPDQMPPMNQDDVATSITFRWDGATVTDGVASGGFMVREYFVQDRGPMGGNKVVIVHQDAEVMTSKFVGGLIAAAYQ
jgi:hypothetical protein